MFISSTSKTVPLHEAGKPTTPVVFLGDRGAGGVRVSESDVNIFSATRSIQVTTKDGTYELRVAGKKDVRTDREICFELFDDKKDYYIFLRDENNHSLHKFSSGSKIEEPMTLKDLELIADTVKASDLLPVLKDKFTVVLPHLKEIAQT